MSKYICPHCKNPIDDDEALLCLFCGESLERAVGTLGKMRYSVHWAVVAVVIAIVIAAFIVLISSCSSAKQADLAGEWYSDNSEELSSELGGYIEKAKGATIVGEVIGLIAPHAGFRFSGPVAAYAYKALAAKAPSKIIVVGFSHSKYFPGKTAIFTGEAFTTPLGKMLIDKDISQKLMSASETIQDIPEAFESENSIEMQIPFIQMAAPGAKLVLIALCDQRQETYKNLADALSLILKDEKDFVMIASSDMSHYLTYDLARQRDDLTIGAIKAFDVDAFYMKSLRAHHELMCGFGVASAVMEVCKKLGADKVEILKYLNSGDVTGDKTRVVGYLSAAFVRTVARDSSPVARENELQTISDEPRATSDKESANMFNQAERTELLNVARNTIRDYLKTGKIPEVKVSDEKLKQDMGAFVTLHKDGELRGCIGNIVAQGPLHLAVRDMAIAAATEDPRFRPVSSEELEKLEIEISALSPMKKISNPDEIVVGKHGVLVRMGARSGVYLPQVATETGWTKEEFMNSLCGQKAGIPRDAWKTGKCEMYVFTAEVFGEKDNR